MENTQQQVDKKANIVVEVIKKNKKNEPKIFPSLMLVDKEAFDNDEHTKFIMKEFWSSNNNKIIVARKQDTQAIVGYAIFSVCDLQDKRFGKKWFPSVYLMRIGVRLLCQRQGIGRKLVSYLMETYPTQSLSLDVGTDNEKGVKFYQRMGMKIQKLYMSPNNDEFALFETPLDKLGNKIMSGDEETETIQPYFNDIEDYKVYHLFMESQKILEQVNLNEAKTIKIEVKIETDEIKEDKITVEDKSLSTPMRETSPASDETQSSVNTTNSNKVQAQKQAEPKQFKMNVNAPAFVMNVKAPMWTPNFKV